MATPNPIVEPLVEPFEAPAVPIVASWADKTRRLRPTVRGKFLYLGDEKYWVKGVTYGTFKPDAEGMQFPAREVAERDMATMAANGINTFRTYTMPPRWLLDAALRHGLRVMVGLPWEQHVAFLDDPAITRRILDRMRGDVRSCAGHPAVLCYTLGNEIPAPIVRWHGNRRIEQFIERLYRTAKAEDPEGLFTYVNYPATEYLRLPFLDIFCANVYLEKRETLEAYLARLQNLAGDRPLLMAEIGLDSRRNGLEKQAESLAWQVRTAFASGCAGAFAFAWTDEWYRGGFDIEDWDFGLTARDRAPKPALTAVREAFADAPFPKDAAWPKFSVVVCSYNGAKTIRDTLEGLKALEYPNYEVIVVNDGSTDATPRIAAEYPFRLISSENRGLSNARNTGWQEATGEIVAYIDDDAYPDPHWLHYLAHTFMTTDYVGVGGPNIAPPGDGPIADCVANAPGGPVHVLVSDTEAEHIPGCNMAFRRDALAAIGGFDPRYRAAGDDVDVCWRLQARGWKIGFSAAAMDWHHRRNSIRMYWKQQQGYGKAEALLEAKWPEKYNGLGHISWSGRLYGKGLTRALSLRRERIFQGQWGQAPFQSVYEPGAGFFSSLPLMPEWFLLIAGLAMLSLLGLTWAPLLWATPLLGMAILAPLVQAGLSAAKAEFPTHWPAKRTRVKLRLITALLHVLQPVARLKGRLQHGLTLGRTRISAAPRWRLAGSLSLWSEKWRAPEAWLTDLTSLVQMQHAVVRKGSEYDRWDLEVSGGAFGAVRVLLGIEEHGAGKQLLRFRVRPVVSLWTVAGILTFGTLTAVAASQGGWLAAAALGAATAYTVYSTYRQVGSAFATIANAVLGIEEQTVASSKAAYATD